MGRGPSIEGRKNAADASRGKLFTKLIREITIAARTGGPDPAGNARLRAGIDKAKAVSMPNDTIERALKRASGADADKMEEIRYEGYGPSGVALIIDCMTDNSQRTVADVRSALAKHGGNLGTSGSVAFQFKHVGEFVIDTSKPGSEDKLLEVALDAGADDVQTDAGESIVLTAPENFEKVKQALAAAGLNASKADVIWRPDNRTPVNGDVAETLRDLLDKLDDLDDVQNVYHNAELAM
ncbi:MAG: YebC/PmpR family DNA-binding transcriptional regulator [Proteobacteria bacterium]|nr:YebC/PmpR family DNA-binding transcriptional regulator [Pseudomonadota bacterium]